MIVFRILKFAFLAFVTHQTFDKFIDMLTGTVKAGRNIRK